MARTPIFRLATLLIVALCNACMYTPANESEIANKNVAISISGIGPVNESVIIRVAPDPAGPWTDLVELNTDGSGAYNGSEVVPVSAWMPICGAQAGGYETFVRADLPAGGSLATFDDAPIGSTGQDCVAGYIADDNLAGVTNCVSPDSPVARVVALAGGGGPSFHNGDVVIDDPADVEALACVETILGSLTIDDAVVEDLALMRLSGVTGDVNVVLERDSNLFEVTERAHLPALTAVGGNVDLHAPRPVPPVPGGQNVSVDFDMDALISIGGALAMQVDSFNCTVSGFAGMTWLTGSLDYESCDADGSGSNLLPAMTTVDGDLMASFGSSTQNSFFNSVQHVGGDLTAQNGVWNTFGPNGSMFTSVVSVVGTLRVADVFIQPAPDPIAFDALTVAGAIDWESSNPIEAIGGAAVLVGGLRLDSNGSWLDELDVRMSKFQIAPLAPITITNNGDLPECHAEDWAEALPGHTGPVDISGNLFCPIILPPPIFTGRSIPDPDPTFNGGLTTR